MVTTIVIKKGEIMKILKTALILLCVLLFINSCKDKESKQELALASIDLLRGELLLCGDGQFGELKFSLSCNYETRPTFDLGMALLHSFQYTEAEKAFVKVIDADPNCPMAYWGVAMSIYHAAWFPPKEKELIKGVEILKIAKALSMDEKQRDYINAIDAFYTNWENEDHQTRAKLFENKMEQIYLKYPDDVEAAIFYSLALYSTRDRVGKEYDNERKAGIILESLFKTNPNHPGIAHYIIHNYDNPVLAPKALETARRYAAIAPSSSHAQHMPSHIFTRLGIWEESIESNLLSAESSRCYTESANIEEAYFEELHAIDYLIYAYLQKGDNKNAKEQYTLIKELEAFHETNLTASIYPIAIIPARIALENRDWDQAAHLNLQEIELNWNDHPWSKAVHHFAKSLGASQTKDFSLANQEIEMLKIMRQNLIDQEDKTKSIQIKLVEIQIKTAQAWIYYRNNNPIKGLDLMLEAVEIERKTSKHPLTPGDVLPAIELLGDMLLEMGRNEEALISYQENLKRHPNRFNGLYGAAKAAKNVGNKEQATTYFKSLLSLVEKSGSERPEILEAKAFIKQSV